MKITATFLQPPNLSTSAAGPSGEKPAVRYDPDLDGNLAKFESSAKGKQLMSQYRTGIGKLKDFLQANNSSRAGEAASALDEFGGRVAGGSRGFFSTQASRLYNEGKAALDTLCVDLDDQIIPLHKRLSVVENLAEGLLVCSEGSASNLIMAAQDLRLSTGGLNGYAKSVWEDMFDQAILEFCRRKHRDSENYAGDEIHFANGYRNYLTDQFGVATRVDTFVPLAEVGQNVDEAADFVRDRVTADALVNHLASSCLAEVREHFTDYLDRPLTWKEVGQFYREFEESLETSLQVRYGKIDCNVLVSASEGKGTEDAPYTVIDQPALLTRAIGRNLKEAGLFEKKKFSVEFSEQTPDVQMQIKKTTDDVFYVKQKHRNGEVIYRNPQPTDLAPLGKNLSRSLLLATLKSTTDPEKLQAVHPSLVWEAINRPDVAEVDRWLEDFVHPAVRRYRDASPDNNAELEGKIVEHVKTLSLYAQQVVVGSLMVVSEPSLALQVAASIDLFDWQTNEGNTLAHTAATRGHAQMLSMMVSKGASIDKQNASGVTPLMLAAFKGKASVVEFLLSADARVDTADDIGETALMKAAARGEAAIVAALLKKNAQVELKCTNGVNALHLAAIEGHAAVVDLILSADVGVDTVDDSGETALMKAACFGETAVVAALLKKNAQVELKREDGENALMLAASGGHAAVVDLLLSADVGVDTADNNGETALMKAACFGETAVVAALLKKNAQVELKREDGENALMLAASGGHAAVVDLLFSAGATVDAMDGGGNTALMKAALKGQAEIVDILLEKKAQVELKSDAGYNALLFAANCGHAAVVDKLLRIGRADVTATDIDGATAFHGAAFNNCLEVVQLMMEANAADFHAKTTNGKTALALAAIKDNAAMIDLLAPESDLNTVDPHSHHTPLIWAVLKESQNAVAALVAHGADINMRPMWTALTAAASVSNADMVECLLGAGAQVDMTDGQGLTALAMAAKVGNVDIVQRLLDAGAQVDKRTAEMDRTALGWAAVSGHAEVVSALIAVSDVETLERGSSNANSALTLAATNGHADVVHQLLVAGFRKGIGTALRIARQHGHQDVVNLLNEIAPAPSRRPRARRR